MHCTFSVILQKQPKQFLMSMQNTFMYYCAYPQLEVNEIELCTNSWFFLLFLITKSDINKKHINIWIVSWLRKYQPFPNITKKAFILTEFRHNTQTFILVSNTDLFSVGFSSHTESRVLERFAISTCPQPIGLWWGTPVLFSFIPQSSRLVQKGVNWVPMP